MARLVVDPYGPEPEERPADHVRFVLGDRWDEAIDVQVREDRDGVYLYVSGLGANGLSLRPYSGNVVLVRQP